MSKKRAMAEIEKQERAMGKKFPAKARKALLSTLPTDREHDDMDLLLKEIQIYGIEHVREVVEQVRKSNEKVVK